MSPRILSGIRRNWASFLGLALLIVSGPMCGSGGGGGGGGAPPVPVVFQVLSTTPADTLGNVNRTATLFVLVNGITNPATLTAANITVTGAAGITLLLNWNAATNMIEIVPNSPSGAWDSGQLHTVVISAGVRTMGGTSMTPHTFTFTTNANADVGRPTFAGGLTSIDMVTTTSVRLNWTQGTDVVTTQPNLVYEVYLSTSPGAENLSQAPVTTTTGASNVTVLALTPNTTYYFVVRCRDQAGNRDLNTIERSKTTFVSFLTNIYNPIIVTICQQCHAPAPAMASFMDLQTGGAAGALAVWVDQPANSGTGISPAPACGGAGNIRVIATPTPDAPNSLVYRKISQAVPSCGVRMPEGLPPLSATQIQLFFDWISQGAANN